MNIVTIIGRLTRDADIRQITNGKMAAFTVAVDRNTKDGGADFIRVNMLTGAYVTDQGDGTLAVVNVYIDEDVAAWREYEPNYPRAWLCGYDAAGLIRSDRLYNVRAIPSLYLLDGRKRVLMKDAPVERVVSWLQNQQNT